MQEVASRAGVSTATVSRVVNGSHLVNKETAERVRRVIQKLNFYPNTHASSLVSGRSRIFGLIIPDITNPFFPELVRSFENVVVDHDEEVIIANTDYHPARMQAAGRRMLRRKVDGVAIMASALDPASIEALLQNGISVVTLDAGRIGPGISDISINYSTGIEQAMEHLSGLGHIRVAYIGGPADWRSSILRQAAFLASLQKKRKSEPSELLQVGNYRIDGGHAAMSHLLRLRERPTAVLTCNDLTAIGALRAIHEHGLKVPKDISVVGFDDIDLSSFTYPPLTTIRLSRTEMAMHAYSALVTMRNQPKVSGMQYTVNTSLVIRQSSGLARQIHSSSRKRS